MRLPCYAPSRLPGAGVASTKALLDVLKDNHEKWHIFFNDLRSHNHVSHHVLAIWALGANKDLIQAAYKYDIPIQKPVIKPPGVVDESNFNDHLGAEEYYVAYVDFFKAKITEKGVSQVLENYVFARSANIIDGAAQNKQPLMLARLFDGAAHPMIHVGYGLEFGLSGMVVEGLAQAAVHEARDAPFYPASLFESVSAVDTLASKVVTDLVLDGPKSPLAPSKPKEVHLFDIMARILKDDRFKAPPADAKNFFTDTMKANSSAIVEYANQWTLNLDEPHNVHRKIEQLQWMNSLVYSVSGFNAPEKEFFADFFLMHLVTSSLFLPSIVAYLTPPSQKLFLRGYLTISLAFWVSRRPRSFNLDVAKFFSADLAMPKRPSLTFESPSWALVPGTATANQWFPIIQDAILHQDDHLCKIQRAFMHFAEQYGSRESGLEDFASTELPGANAIDGSLFIRAAGLTAKAMGRVISEDEGMGWDR
ncbi:hypothetical protein BDZ89DRAFT_1072726 [Hymenopellis radicata]|nr:hypothetical protein BDZ89DRAFT_1072726 [Hymenopellis radicata]